MRVINSSLIFLINGQPGTVHACKLHLKIQQLVGTSKTLDTFLPSGHTHKNFNSLLPDVTIAYLRAYRDSELLDNLRVCAK
jgi:hypothetical protein